MGVRHVALRDGLQIPDMCIQLLRAGQWLNNTCIYSAGDHDCVAQAGGAVLEHLCPSLVLTRRAPLSIAAAQKAAHAA